MTSSAPDRPWPLTLRALLAIGVFLLPVVLVWAGLRSGVVRPLGGPAPEPEENAIRIVCSIPPVAGLARLLDGGDGPVRLDIRTVLPPGVSEHGFEVTPTAAASLARADLVIVVGAGLDPQVESAAQRARPTPVVVRFADVVGVESDIDHDHAHDDGHNHAHGVDPHLWLDPVLVEQCVPALRRSIEDVAIRAGLDADAVRMQMNDAERRALETVRSIDAAHRERLEPFEGRAIATHHAAFGRLADRYGLVVAAVVRIAPTSEPTPAAVAEVSRLARERSVGAIFVEPQSSAREVERLADAASLRVLTLDPLGDGDWAAMMRTNLDALVEGLSSTP